MLCIIRERVSSRGKGGGERGAYPHILTGLMTNVLPIVIGQMLEQPLNKCITKIHNAPVESFNLFSPGIVVTLLEELIPAPYTMPVNNRHAIVGQVSLTVHV